MNKALSGCPICGYPTNVEYEGQTIQCAFCGAKFEVTINQRKKRDEIIASMPEIIGRAIARMLLEHTSEPQGGSNP